VVRLAAGRPGGPRKAHPRKQSQGAVVDREREPPFGAPTVSLREFVCAAPDVAFCARKPMMPAGTPACAPDLDRIVRTPLMPAG
jgi:hypothetical protein